MSNARFACNAVITFDLFALPEWVRGERAAGRIGADEGPVQVSVVHPDREADGSCRWCGCRENEIVAVDA